MPNSFLNRAIPPEWDDQVYFYAYRLFLHKKSGEWFVYLQPEACFVSLRQDDHGLPTVDNLRREHLRVWEQNENIFYEGRILFSSGAILIINNKFLLLQRDDKAPVDPLMWTSPAGRCDREPKLTGFKEFYEEIILWDKRQKKPIFIVFPESEPYLDYLKYVYSETLGRKNRAVPAAQWVYLRADIPAQYVPFISEVRTFFGEGEEAEEYDGKFFVFWDEACNTLELRLLASVKVDQGVAEAIQCFDGEYDRPARLFTLEEFMALPEKDLVATMVEFRKRLTE